MYSIHYAFQYLAQTAMFDLHTLKSSRKWNAVKMIFGNGVLLYNSIRDCMTLTVMVSHLYYANKVQ